MADKKFSEAPLIAIADIATQDTVWTLDKSDTTDGPEGTIKQAPAEAFRNFKTLIASVNYLNLAGIDASISFFNYIPAAINAQGPFTANAGEQFVFYTIQGAGLEKHNAVFTYYQVYTGELIVGGSNPTYQINGSNIMLSGGPKELSAVKDPEFFIELDDINSDPVEDAFNLGDVANTQDWTIAGEMFITCIINNVDIIYRFIGALGDYGPTGLTAVAGDFQDLTTQGTPEPYAETTPGATKNNSAYIRLDNFEGIEQSPGTWSSIIAYATNSEVLYGRARKQINALTQPTVRTSVEAAATDIIIGKEYTIKTVGTTDFTAIGASANTPTVIFTATGVGTGTGEVYKQALQIGGNAFVSNTNMYLEFKKGGEDVEYRFLSLEQNSASGIEEAPNDGKQYARKALSWEEVTVGAGDMLKATYDTNNNGIVDNAEKVNGKTVDETVPPGAVFTDTVYNDTAIQAEVDLNTAKVTFPEAPNDGKDYTRKNLAWSRIVLGETKSMSTTVYAKTIDVKTGDSDVDFGIGSDLNGWNLVNVVAIVTTKGVTGSTNVQVVRRRNNAIIYMLSTAVSLGNEYFAQDGVIDASFDDVATGDLIYFDVTAIHSGTTPKGLTMVLEFEKP